MIASKFNILFYLTVILLAVIFLSSTIACVTPQTGIDRILSQPVDIGCQLLLKPVLDLENLNLSFDKFVKYITNDITDTIEECRLILLIHMGLFVRQRISEPVCVSDKKTFLLRMDTPVIALFLGGHSPPAAFISGKNQ